jgi:dTDP-4-amino-4,6-dideoxygalactose transaminase
MSSPDITAAEIEAVNAVLKTPVLSIGPRIAEFEQAVASYMGLRYGVGVNSGTSGLHMCVIGGGVGEGDYVITTPFSFIASANAILYERAIPVFVDIDLATGNIDPEQVAEAARDLASGSANAARWLPPSMRSAASHPIPSRLKCIMPVHAFGQPADMDPIMAVARDHKLTVIEDACEAIGAEFKGRRAGTFGDSAVFAFYPNKQMTTGEGGMIVTDDQELDSLFRSLRNQGRDVFDAWLNHTRLGYNYRLDEMSAALGVVQISRIDELISKRNQVATWYNQRVDTIPGVEKPFVAGTTSRMSWFVYVVRCENSAARDTLMAYLQERDIPTRPYFTPIHLQPFYMQQFGWSRGDFPNTESAGDTFLALPFSSVMTEEQVDYVCQHIQECMEANDGR